MDYYPLMGKDEYEDPPQLRSGKVQKYKAALMTAVKKTAKFAAAEGASDVAGIIGIGALLNLPSFISTRGHIKRLEIIDRCYPCDCDQCDEVLAYVISQKQKKKSRSKTASVPVVSWKESARKIKRRVGKTDPGKERSYWAHELWANAKPQGAAPADSESARLLDFSGDRGSCILAKGIIAELFGSFKKQSSWEYAEALCQIQAGPSIIAEKMRSA